MSIFVRLDRRTGDLVFDGLGQELWPRDGALTEDAWDAVMARALEAMEFACQSEEFIRMRLAAGWDGQGQS